MRGPVAYARSGGLRAGTGRSQGGGRYHFQTLRKGIARG